MATPEVQAFLDATLAAQLDAERALHNGDVVPRLSTWSHGDQITLFGAGVPRRTGWREVRPVFEWLASRFAECDEYSFELLAAGVSGDLAYTVELEHTSVSVDGGIHGLRVAPEGGWGVSATWSWRIGMRPGDPGEVVDRAVTGDIREVLSGLEPPWRRPPAADTRPTAHA